MRYVLLVLVIAMMSMCKPSATIDNTKSEVPPAPIPQVVAVPKLIINKAGLYDGAKLGVKPGDTVGIQAGTYANLILNNFTGTADKPIVFINYQGQVFIQGTTQNNGNFSINGSSFFILTGSGVDNIKYGFNVSSTYKDVSALVIAGKSTNCEVTRVEVSQSGFAGMMIKTDPNKADPSTWFGNFIMRDVNVHDNYVHDTQSEGFYIGNSFWNTGLNGVYPHEIYGLQVYRNIVRRSGAEGIQYSCSPGAKVHHNTVISTGNTPFANDQNNGVQISGGSSGEFYANTIDSARGVGLIIVGALRGGDSLLIQNVLITHSNIFAGSTNLPPQTCGIFADERASPPGVPPGGKQIIQNVTVDGARLDGIRLYNETQNNVIRNTAIINYVRYAIDLSPKTVPLVQQNNFTGTGAIPAGIGYLGGN